MFKTIVAASVATLASAAINGEFIQGVQTGAFITNEEHFADYNCPEPELSGEVEKYKGMYNMAKNMVKPKSSKSVSKTTKAASASQSTDIFDKIDKYADQVGVIMSVMDPSYEGGDFCQGLTVGFEARKVGQGAAMELVKKAMSGKKN